MPDEQYPDPLTEAAGHSGERTVQLLSLLAAGGQVFARMRAHTKANRTREIELERQHARLRWAPAHDPRWLRQADMLQTARVWGAAMPYADEGTSWFDRSAQSAMDKCENRLRTLHPYAMSRYDRLRADGYVPQAAMREATPLFSGPSQVWEQGPVTRVPHALSSAPPGTIPERGATFDLSAHGPSAEEFRLVQRAGKVTEDLRETARAQGREPPTPEELRTLLHAATNLPDDVIRQVTTPTRQADDVGLAHDLTQRAVADERARNLDLGDAADNPATPAADERTEHLHDARRHATHAANARTRAVHTPVQLAATDFPFTLDQVMRAARNHNENSPNSNLRATVRINPSPRSHRGRI